MAATIKDIARRLNISVSTVSYALNGGPRPVPADVRDRVLSVAKELNYRPNRVARSMITGRSHTIGVIPPVVTRDAFLSPYLHLALNGIVNEAGKLHQDILIFTRYDESEREEAITAILDGRVDGVVFVSPHQRLVSLEVATSRHLPCVTVSGAPIDGVLAFTADNEAGTELALQHLYDLGHRKIGYIAGRLDMQDAMNRLQAYQRFLYEKGLPYRDRWVSKGQFEIEGGRRAMAELLGQDEAPTAVACGNDEMAIGAMLCAFDRGLKIPQDVSIVGFDDTPSSQHVYPALTTVRQPMGQLGSAALRALFDLIEGRQPSGPNVLSTELIVRGSTTHPKENP